MGYEGALTHLYPALSPSCNLHRFPLRKHPGSSVASPRARHGIIQLRWEPAAGPETLLLLLISFAPRQLGEAIVQIDLVQRVI